VYSSGRYLRIQAFRYATLRSPEKKNPKNARCMRAAQQASARCRQPRAARGSKNRAVAGNRQMLCAGRAKAVARCSGAARRAGRKAGSSGRQAWQRCNACGAWREMRAARVLPAR